MSYDIEFKVKVEGVDKWLPVGYQTANVTYNIREMIVKSTGLEWKNDDNNGLVKDIIPFIEHGLDELTNHEEAYVKYNSPNGWGTTSGCKNFFQRILYDWEEFQIEYPELVDIATFWIE